MPRNIRTQTLSISTSMLVNMSLSLTGKPPSLPEQIQLISIVSVSLQSDTILATHLHKDSAK